MTKGSDDRKRANFAKTQSRKLTAAPALKQPSIPTGWTRKIDGVDYHVTPVVKLFTDKSNKTRLIQLYIHALTGQRVWYDLPHEVEPIEAPAPSVEAGVEA